MKLPATLTPAMVDHLNRTYFSKVWNSPDENAGANFKLLKAHKRLAVGTVPLDRSVVGLPTTDRVYATYRLPRHYLTNYVKFTPHQWVSDSTLTDLYFLSISVYTEGGRKLPSGSVFFYYNHLKSELVVAVEYQYTSKCAGVSYPDLYATVYLDPTRNTPVVSDLYACTNASATSVANNAVIAARAHPVMSQIWINGWCYTPLQAPTLILGDIVEIITDPDITSYCEINVDSNTTGYQSVKYAGYRDIIHIPKTLNPHGYVITTNTLLMVVYDPITKKGVLGHRIHPHALEPITHNDFSVGRDWLNHFAQTMGVDTVSLRLYVRFSATPHRLGNDVNHMADLYTLPDSEIKKQLIGTSSQQIEPWRAEHLEQSTWFDLAYNFKPFALTNIIQKYAEAMGYYDVASVLSQLVHYHTYQGASLKIQKPARLKGYPCEVAIWANGVKLPDDTIETVRDDGHSFEVGFNKGHGLQIGDELVLYILTGGERVPIAWTPSASSPTITLPSDDYQLVRIFSYPSPQSVWNGTTTKGYRALPASPGDYTVTSNVNGTATYKANATNYNKQFYLVPLAPSFTTTWDIQPYLDNNEAVVIALETQNAQQQLIPLIGRATLEFYLNGYRLSEGLDYTVSEVLGSYNDRLQYLFTLSCQNYLDLDNGGNVLEMICHTDHLVSQDTGYVISQSAFRDEPPCFWSKSCGRLFVGGKIVSSVADEGNNLTIDDPVSDGLPFLSEWSLPYGTQKLLANVNPADQTNDLFRISTVMGEYPPTYPSIVVLDHLHALFSPTLAQIVHDVAQGTFTLHNEPNDERFIGQLRPYKILIDADPVLSHNPLIDRRFVTLAAHYTNLSVDDPQQMHFVQRLVTFLLNPSTLSIREVLL